MNSGVRQVNDLVVKHSRTASDSAALVERTHLLRAQGLKTPAVRLSPSGRNLYFQRIDGNTAQAHLLEAGAGKDLVPVLKRSLHPVAFLHTSKVVRASSYQPFRLIDPRLDIMAERGRCRSEDRKLATTIRAGLLRIIPPVPVRNCLLHGDLHPGQIILERPPITAAWLIDLDDMCLGDLEADLGNLVAHLLTSGVLDSPLTASMMSNVIDAVCHAYECNTSLKVDHKLVTVYGKAALLRRALKLMLDRNQPDAARRIMQLLAAGLLAPIDLVAGERTNLP